MTHQAQIQPSPPATWQDMSTPERLVVIKSYGPEINPRAVADELGTSRAAIIGFCWRNKVTIPSYVTPSSVSAMRGGTPAPRFPVAPEVPESTWDAIYGVATHAGTCCWPVGEAGGSAQQFCAGHKVKGRSYCAEHSAMAYLPKEPVRPAGETTNACYVPAGITIQEAVAVVRPRASRKVGAE